MSEFASNRKPPTRLAFCITELDAGGAERALTQLVTGLDRNEWEPHVICLGPPGHFVDTLKSAGIPVVCLNARGLRSLPRALIELTRELRRLRPALLQTFLFHANILGRISAYLAGIWPVVSGVRVAERRSSWYGRFDRWTNALVTTNVCVSQGVADFSEHVVGLNRDKLLVIPNSVDFQRFAHATPADLTEFGIPAGSRVLISIGRLERQKGIDILIEAIEVSKPLPQNLHFLIVGDGPDLDDLCTLVEQKSLSRQIHFAKRRNDVPELLAASTALILPSRWEGMPNVVLEAMAAAKPVIATRVEGTTELVKDDETGLTVPAESPADLARAIQKLLADQTFQRQAGQAAQSVVIKEFAKESINQMYTNLYDRLLKISR